MPDDLTGGGGHDAISGGAGHDVFHNVVARDRDVTNTLDGTHSVDGGSHEVTVAGAGGARVTVVVDHEVHVNPS